MSQRVIFLDVDGVLVTARLLKQRQGRQRCADDECVRNLNRLTSETGASIVVSSSWRFCGENEMRKILEFWQVKAPMIGITPDLTRTDGRLYTAVERGHEIQAWLDGNPTVESFVILDDEADMVHLLPRLVKTEFECGLTSADVDKAKELLAACASPNKGEQNGA